MPSTTVRAIGARSLLDFDRGNGFAGFGPALVEAVGTAGTGLALLDSRGCLLAFNQAFAALAGGVAISPGLPLGRAIAPLADDARLADFLAAVDRALTGSEAAEVDFASADERWLSLAIEPGGGSARLAVLRDVSETVVRKKTAEIEARLDLLTRLGNRKAYLERLQAWRDEADGPGLAVVLLDLDHFKAVNDTLGHAVGDALLKLVAQRLRSGVGPEDLVVRLGGDEFAVVHQGREPGGTAAAMAERLIALLKRPFLVEGQVVAIGASAGIEHSEDRAAGLDGFLRRADLALYRAKEDGRGVARRFEPSLEQKVLERRQLENDLRKALPMKEFTLVYQPQLDLESNRITGFEALMRWHHHERGLVPPSVFIPLAEELGLIPQLGEWALRTACAEAAGWPEPLTIAVNVSALQISAEGFVPMVVSALAAAGLPASRLEIEITESVLLGETDAVLERLRRLRDLGVMIAMDDFGTGYSSLSYLNAFPFSKIKIDQSFIRQGGEAGRADELVKAIAALGRSLGMATTAEGVETADQMERIRLVGCSAMQGYLLARPMPPGEIPSILASHGRQDTA